MRMKVNVIHKSWDVSKCIVENRWSCICKSRLVIGRVGHVQNREKIIYYFINNAVLYV